MLEAGSLPVHGHVARDASAIHSALASAGNTLDILQICDEHLPEPGQTVWSVCGVRPFPCGFVYGPSPVADSDLCDLMARGPDASSLVETGSLSPRRQGLLCRWQDPDAVPETLAVGEGAQTRLEAAGAFYGVLQAAPVVGASPCPAVDGVLQAASVYLVLSLERMAGAALLDPLTGLWSPEEFRRRVEVEVDRAHAYPTEFSLVLMEVRVRPHREPGCLTEPELRAVGQVIIECLRGSDSAARFEDGRFGLLLPTTCQRDSFIAVARVTDRLREHPDLSPGLECGIGVSGWSFEGSNGNELFRQAATALENAKSAGARGAFVFL